MIITAYKRLDNGIQVYNLVFNEEAAVPTIHECVSIECDLYIRLTYHCLLLTLLEWFRYCTLIRYSLLENFASYTKSKGGDYKKNQKNWSNSTLYSASSCNNLQYMTRFSLLIRYTSLKPYKYFWSSCLYLLSAFKNK